MYNESLLINATTIFDGFSAINQTTSTPYLLSISLVVVLWIIFLIVPILAVGFIRSAAFSSFVSSILSGFLWAAGELPGEFIILPVIMTIVFVFFLISES
jgi:hypothetical protein